MQVRIGFYNWLEDTSNAYNEKLKGSEEGAVKSDGAPAEAPQPPLILRVLCCTSTSFHWWTDTAVGVILSLGFVVASSIVLSPGAPPPTLTNNIKDMSYLAFASS